MCFYYLNYLSFTKKIEDMLNTTTKRIFYYSVNVNLNSILIAEAL